jgi:hypothetical protein
MLKNIIDRLTDKLLDIFDRLTDKLLDIFFPLDNIIRLYLQQLQQADNEQSDVASTRASRISTGSASDGTLYGHKPYPGAELGRGLDRRAALVPPYAPGVPLPGKPACPGWLCRGPRAKA